MKTTIIVLLMLFGFSSFASVKPTHKTITTKQLVRKAKKLKSGSTAYFEKPNCKYHKKHKK